VQKQKLAGVGARPDLVERLFFQLLGCGIQPVLIPAADADELETWVGRERRRMVHSALADARDNNTIRRH
jgi:hypothetical protein